MLGVIKAKTEKGFGFIRSEGSSKDVFFHMTHLKNIDFDDLNVGDNVEFELTEGEKGPAAVEVFAV